ncbi:MAG: NHL repeat-containing protein, partial [bacterium]
HPRWILIVVAIIASHPSSRAQTVYTLDSTLEETRGHLLLLDGPTGVACDASGNIYLADTLKSLIRKIDPDGNLLFQFGGPGNGPGQLSLPQSLALDSQGNIFVADTGNKRIQKFDPLGQPLFRWDISGPDSDTDFTPVGIAVSPGGDIYFTDIQNNMVHRFTANGVFVSYWGGSGLGNAQFFTPFHLAFGPQGDLFVADGLNHRIQKFTSDGLFLMKWGSRGTGNGQFQQPYGIAVRGDSVYVTDSLNRRIQVFDTSGIFDSVLNGGSCNWGLLGRGGIALDPQNRIVVADSGNSRALRLDPFSQEILEVWGRSPGSQGGSDFLAPRGVFRDWLGLTSVVDTGHNQIQTYDPQGRLLAAFGSFGVLPGQFNVPSHAALDPSGRVVIVDKANHRLQVLDSGTGANPEVIGSGPGAGPDKFNSPSAVAITPTGRYYIADTLNNRVLVYQTGQGFVGQFGAGTDTTGAYDFKQPTGIAYDRAGFVYVADTGNDRVVKFNPSDLKTRIFGTPGSGIGQLASPEGVAVDINGDVYIADTGNRRIQKFDEFANYLTSFGNPGNCPGQMDLPQQVWVDSEGFVYVADAGNNRIQRWRPPIVRLKDNPFDAGEEGWTSYDIADFFSTPSFSFSEGRLAIRAQNNVNTFGFWLSPLLSTDSPVPSMFWIRATVSTDEPDPTRVPTFRLRVSSSNFQKSDILNVTSAGSAGHDTPLAWGRTYSLFVKPLETLTPLGNYRSDISVAFDCLNFSPRDNPTAELRLEQVVIDRIPDADFETLDILYNYFFDLDTAGWQYFSIPALYSAPISGRENASLTLTSTSNSNTFGFWQSPLNHLSFRSLEDLYRVTFKISTDETQGDKVPGMRLRINAGDGQAAIEQRIDSFGLGEQSPTPVPKDYKVYFYSSPPTISGADIISAFDLINFDPGDSPDAKFFLNHVTVERMRFRY